MTPAAERTGLCECGCGQQTRLATQSRRDGSEVKGLSRRFVPGHNGRLKTPKRYRERDGSREHVGVAEQVLGKPLPRGAVVHHVDEDKLNNDPSNLVICQDVGYHSLLHRRMDAVAACGNPSWRKCARCRRYDDVHRLHSPRAGTLYHWVEEGYCDPPRRSLSMTRDSIRKRDKRAARVAA